MTPAQLIQKKRDGKKLSNAEIHHFIQGMMKGEIADYQVSAFLMAVFFRQMDLEETVALTEAMVESGERYDLKGIDHPTSDKHSTGGVGDKVSLILGPLAAACGVSVPMMAGRGLGHTGGTVDKLESIPGYNTQLSAAKFNEIVKDVGCSIVGQSQNIAPADKKLYALRDVTGTIECIPLITGSILSKKIAEGTRTLIMDIKVGTGAFMKSKPQARELAKTLIQVGKKMGLPIRCLLTDMSQPLGYSAGNSLEVLECIEILKNKKGLLPGELSSTDLKEITLQLCAQMIQIAKVRKTLPEAKKLAIAKLADGSAWEKFRQMVVAQGGNVDFIDHPEKMPVSKKTLVIKSPKKGIVNELHPEKLGWLVVELGGGRKTMTDPIDPGVGILFHKKLGASIKAGEPIATVYLPENGKNSITSAQVEERFWDAALVSGTRKPVPKLVSETLDR
ncbi:MAG: thymidine phosphorylase [Bdellovibrionales bacterium]|nr:thymidine phosphorylase [Bdellovibrionales bacterium]